MARRIIVFILCCLLFTLALWALTSEAHAETWTQYTEEPYVLQECTAYQCTTSTTSLFYLESGTAGVATGTTILTNINWSGYATRDFRVQILDINDNVLADTGTFSYSGYNVGDLEVSSSFITSTNLYSLTQYKLMVSSFANTPGDNKANFYLAGNGVMPYFKLQGNGFNYSYFSTIPNFSTNHLDFTLNYNLQTATSDMDGLYQMYLRYDLYGSSTSTTSTMQKYFSRGIQFSDVSSSSSNEFFDNTDLPNGYYQMRNAWLQFSVIPDSPISTWLIIPISTSNVFSVFMQGNQTPVPISWDTSTTTVSSSTIPSFFGGIWQTLGELFIPSSDNFLIENAWTAYDVYASNKVPFAYFNGMYDIFNEELNVSLYSPSADDAGARQTADINFIVPTFSDSRVTTSYSFLQPKVLNQKLNGYLDHSLCLPNSCPNNSFYEFIRYCIWVTLIIYIFGRWRELNQPQQI